MSFNIANLKDGVAGLLQDTNLDSFFNVNGAIERATRTLLQRADIPEASGRQQLTLYSGVYDYLAPTDIFGGSLVDVRPQGISRSPNDYVYKQPVELFDRTKHLLPNGYQVTFETRKGVGISRIATPKTFVKAILDRMDVTTGWTAAGSASGLTEDDTVYYESPASLRFLLTGASTGTLTKAITSTDLSDYEDVGVIFLAIRTPSITNLTSIEVKIGSSASAYNNVSETEGFLGAWTVDDWLLVAFDLAGASQTGTPDFSHIDYVQVSVTHSGTITNFRVGGLWISLPSPHEMLYQTNSIFQHEDLTITNRIQDDNDVILLNEAAYNIFEHEVAYTLALQGGGTSANGVLQTINAALNGVGNKLGLYDLYRADNPSEEVRTVGSYYD